MPKNMNRRDFNRILAATGSLSLLPFESIAVADGSPKEYDIFAKTALPKKIQRFSFEHLNDFLQTGDPKEPWVLRALLTTFQGLVNRTEPRLFLADGPGDVDWLSIYKNEGYEFEYTDIDDLEQLVRQFGPELDGYVVIDPAFLHSINIAQTWGTLENWMIVAPEHESLVQEIGLQKKQDLRGRWSDRVEAYEWAYENLFPRCSKHIVANMCIDYPHFPSTSSHIRDFLVCNNAFTFDLSAARRQRRENELMDRIYDQLEFPSGVWGWHCCRDHEHWAVARASRKGAYSICAAHSPNFSVHGGFRSEEEPRPVKQPKPRTDLVVEKEKIYIAFMMSDGDALWAMNNLQSRKWASEEKRSFPLSYGFLPLIVDLAPAMHSRFFKTQRPEDYLVAGPAGAGYTYTHLHPEPRKFLRYSKHYMQKSGLDIAYITNWNDDTNWQEVDLPEYNPMLYEEWDHCLGYVRGMGESAFEPHYNFGDKPYVFCGEGTHTWDKDDAATLRGFVEANPNRPLFLVCINNISVSTARLEKVVEGLSGYDVEYVRLDEFMHLLKEAHGKGWVTEDLYPNRKGNEEVLRREAPGNWTKTKAGIERLLPALTASDGEEALARMNDAKANLAFGDEIGDGDKADNLAFALCEKMFSLVKDVLNLHGIYVNRKMPSVDRFMEEHGDWEHVEVVRRLAEVWQDWDQTAVGWEEARKLGTSFVRVFEQADALFEDGQG